jgi:hypothetical protein
MGQRVSRGENLTEVYDVANAVKYLTQREVDERVEAILNAKVLPDIATLKRDVAEVKNTLRVFIGDGNGGGVYGQAEAKKQEQLAGMAADIAELKTEKSVSEGIAEALKEATKKRDGWMKLLLLMAAVIISLLALIFSFNHGQHTSGLRTSTPATVARYNSSVGDR